MRIDLQGTTIIGLLAGNPSPLTGPGTTSHVLIRQDQALVLDPGPMDPAHQAQLLAVLAPYRVTGILVTHAHLDHSQSANHLGALLDAPVHAAGDALFGRSAAMQRLVALGFSGGDEGLDLSFRPDVVLRDGDRINLGDRTIETIATPGHIGGHLAFALGDILFPGDMVMGWSTTIVSPPDGDMTAYMASLDRLMARKWSCGFPTHGDPLDSPNARIETLRTHRLARESAILDALDQGPLTPMAITDRVYLDLHPALHPAAMRNVLAHLIALCDRGLVVAPSGIGLNCEFTRL